MQRRRVLVIALSLVAAFLYALAAVLQHRAAREVPREAAMRPALLTRLAADPVWLTAIVVDVFAYAARFVALRRGSLLLVEPLVVTGLLFALLLGPAFGGPRPHRHEWVGATALIAGLGAFLIVATPGRGRGNATEMGWLFAGILAAAAVLALALLAHRAHGARRALYLGAAAGIVFGLTAALTKAAGHLLNRGIVHAVTSWEPYALVALAVSGLLLSQSAYQAGPLRTSLPVFTVAEPAVAAVIGVLAFHEHLDLHPLALVVEAAAVAAMVWGVFVLGRSPVVVDLREGGHEPDRIR